MLRLDKEPEKNQENSESEADVSASLFPLFLLVQKADAISVERRKDCKIEKLSSSRPIFRQNRYDWDRFDQAARFPSRWVVLAAFSCPMEFVACLV